MESGSIGILRYVKNRVIRIKRCIDSNTMELVIKGDSEVIEKALRKLLLYSWEGPIVRFLEEKEQEKVVKGEELFEDFLKLQRGWVDPNTQVLAIGGDLEGKRMAGIRFTTSL